MKSATLLIVSAAIFLSCSRDKKNEYTLIPYSVTRVFPHDRTAFTQGLVVDHGELFESTGRNGNSWISKVNIGTGQQDKKVVLDRLYFGEGITILDGKLFQLTWQNHTGFVYDLKTFRKIGEFQYNYEGWGITHDGKNLIVSDGTETLHFIDTASLKEVSVVKVHDDFGMLSDLNELEYIDGVVFANQWQTNYILRIDPSSGNVTGRIDLSSIADKIKVLNPEADVLNRIAYEKKSRLILVTGKLWPYLYSLKLEEAVVNQ